MLRTEVNCGVSLATVLALLLAAPMTSAQESGESIEDFEANSFELFIGATLHDGESDASYGASYERRVGTAYEFKFTGWSLAPEVNVDFVDGEVKTILGVSVGWEF